jgi:serine protease Do
MVLVSGGSIGVYEGIRSSNADNSSSIVASNDSSAAESSTGDSSSSKKSDSSQSWIQLASTNGSMSVADIVKKVTPSVVGVQSTFSSSNGSNNNPMNGYGGFFGYGSQGNNGSQGMTGVGTGIIMSKDGYIVTNAHVIYDDEYGYGEASSVQIQMSDEETTYDARIVAYDKEADIAVLKIDADNLTPAEFGDSSSCEVGEMVVAIGNPLGLQFQNTVTCGIISALDRKVTINDNTMTLIQTDTAINNGNSGGPLINSSGQVIGINSAKMSSTYSGEATVEGIGFAIPMSEAKSIVDDLINYGYVTGRPQLGISCQDVTEAVSQAYNIPVGAYIFSVTAGGAADQAGLQPGDVITGIQDQTISTTEELNAVKNQYKAGDTITLTYVRAGETKKVDVTLAEVQQTENN